MRCLYLRLKVENEALHIWKRTNPFILVLHVITCILVSLKWNITSQ